MATSRAATDRAPALADRHLAGRHVARVAAHGWARSPLDVGHPDLLLDG
jgi:hypothetical protein